MRCQYLWRNVERQEYKQSGLTLSLSSGLVDGAKSLASLSHILCKHQFHLKVIA